jgi:hypothetical protein
MSIRKLTQVLELFLIEDVSSVDEVVVVGGLGAVLQALVVTSLQIEAGHRISTCWVKYTQKGKGGHGSHQDIIKFT